MKQTILIEIESDNIQEKKLEGTLKSALHQAGVNCLKVKTNCNILSEFFERDAEFKIRQTALDAETLSELSEDEIATLSSLAAYKFFDTDNIFNHDLMEDIVRETVGIHLRYRK